MCCFCVHYYSSSVVWWDVFCLVFGLGTIVTWTSNFMGVRYVCVVVVVVGIVSTPPPLLAPCAAVKGAGGATTCATAGPLGIGFAAEPPGKFGTLRHRLFSGLTRAGTVGGIGQKANALRSQRPDRSQVGRPVETNQKPGVRIPAQGAQPPPPMRISRRDHDSHANNNYVQDLTKS